MAKVLGLHGKARGKVGSVVYRTEAGIGTIASEYNPNPRNPRTLAQVGQRSKMNLAGRISKIVPYDAIAGLGVSKRTARGRFVSSILLAAANNRGSGGTNDRTSAIDYDKIVISDGLSVDMKSAVSLPADQSVLTITPDFSVSPDNVIGCRYIVIYGNSIEWLGTMVADIDKNNPVAKTIDFSNLVSADDILITAVYQVPIIDSEESVRAVYGALLGAPETSMFRTSYSRQLATLKAFGRSTALGCLKNIA